MIGSPGKYENTHNNRNYLIHFGDRQWQSSGSLYE